MNGRADAISRRCRECDAGVDFDARFCDQCGAEMLGAAAPTSDEQRSWSSGPQDGVVQPVPARAQPMDAVGNDVGPTQTYLGYRLIYSDTGTDFNPLNSVAYHRAMLRQLGATFGVLLTFSFALAAVLLIVWLTSAQGSLGITVGASALDPTTIVFVSSIIWLVVAVLLTALFLSRRLSVQLTEWMITVDGAGSGARTALEHMYSIIYNRQTPVRVIRLVRLKVAHQQQRDYLRVDDGYFTGFVSSFAYGTDLFIGWTFWLSLSPAQWLGLSGRQLLRSSWGNISLSLANDRPKAMREVMHAAVRQGVDLATGRIRPMGQGALDRLTPHSTVRG